VSPRSDLFTDKLSLLLLWVACAVRRVASGISLTDEAYFDRRVHRFDGLFSSFLSIGVFQKGDTRSLLTSVSAPPSRRPGHFRAKSVRGEQDCRASAVGDA